MPECDYKFQIMGSKGVKDEDDDEMTRQSRGVVRIRPRFVKYMWWKRC